VSIPILIIRSTDGLLYLSLQRPQSGTFDAVGGRPHQQPKAISFPTDAKLLHAAIQGLNRMAKKHGVRLRQSYSRIAKHAAMMAGALCPRQTV
jgi:hypothetical protein